MPQKRRPTRRSRANETLMAVPIDTRNGFLAGTPAVHLRGIYNLEREAPAAVRVVVNWPEELKARRANP